MGRLVKVEAELSQEQHLDEGAESSWAKPLVVLLDEDIQSFH